MDLQIFEKSRELGELLVKSPEYAKVQEAEAKYQADELAQQRVGEFNALQNEVQTLMQTPDPDQAVIAQKAEALRNMQEVLTELPTVKAMNEAQTGFSQLLNQVNQVLRFIITGEVEEDGCTGNCSSCGGSCGSAQE